MSQWVSLQSVSTVANASGHARARGITVLGKGFLCTESGVVAAGVRWVRLGWVMRAASQPAAFCSSGNVQGGRKFSLLARVVVGRVVAGRTITRLSRHKPRGREAMRWDSIGYDRIR